jgi:hypothetical protein
MGTKSASVLTTLAASATLAIFLVRRRLGAIADCEPPRWARTSMKRPSGAERE